MDPPRPVPLPSSLLSVVLSYLVPAPNPPLPPEILSLSLTQLHTYLPPSLDDPIAHFLPSSTVSADVKEQIGEAVHEIGRMMGESEHPSLEPTYAFPDPLTLQARILLYATPDVQSPSLELLFTYEGPERSWRLDGLRRASDSPAGVHWTSLDDALQVGRQAADKLAHEHELDEAKADEDRTEDFWGGYDSPPPTKEEPALGRADSSASINDDYWAQYGAVDDHVGPPSNNSSPNIGTRTLPGTSSGRSSVRGGSGAAAGSSRRSGSRDAWQREAWGTGGETPVGWTPVITPEHFLNDPRHRSATITQHPSQGPNAAGDRRLSVLSQSSTGSERYPFPTHEDPRTFDRQRWAAEMPNFPEPDFKGATPASMTPSTPPEAPSRMPLGHTVLAPSASANMRSAPPTAFDRPPDSAPIKLTLPDFAAPQRSSLSSESFGPGGPSSGASSLLPAQSPLHATLAGVFALHLTANPTKTREQAAADWLKVALDVVAAQSGAVVNLDGDESPETAQTPVGAVGPFGL